MESIEDSIWAMILCGILALFIWAVAYQKKFFHLPEEDFTKKYPRFIDLVFVFATYFIISIFFVKTIYHTLKTYYPDLPFVGYLSLLNFLTFSLILFFLLAYFLFMNTKILKGIIKEDFSEKKTLTYDVVMGLLALFVILPVTCFCSSLLEIVFYLAFQIKNIPDQSAVKFLKSTLEHPPFFILAIVTITVLAPIIEELLFRGFLQSYLKKYIGRKLAVCSSALLFSLFHFTYEQKIANIFIISVLFTLGLMLGFIYERQKSLISSVALHAGFNIMSILNIIILKDYSFI